MNEYIAQAENSLAGCLLVTPEETIRKVAGIIAAGDFLNDSVRRIYTAAKSLVTAGRACDAVLIQAEASKGGTPIDTQYCADCMQFYLTTANVEETAKVIHDAAIRRRAAEIGVALVHEDLAPVEGLAQLQELVKNQSSGILAPADAAQQVMDRISETADGKRKLFLPTGFLALDEKLSGGLALGGLITIAARPGTGKTTAGLSIAENVAASGQSVLYISLEMNLQQIWSCRAANLSSINRATISNSRHMRDKDWPRLMDAFSLLSERPLYVRDKPSSVDDIEREARCIDGLALVIVDHIGLIRPDTKGSRYEIMTDTTHRLKQLALSLELPILALCQLNRASEQRETKRPNMADLRDSGAIEEDSAVVCLLFREYQYLPENERPKPWEDQEIDFILDKNRYGTTGIVTLTYNGAASRISERRV